MEKTSKKRYVYFFSSQEQSKNVPLISLTGVWLLVVAMVLCHSSVAEAENKATNSFPVVAYHIDLRVQVMPMNTLRALAREISSLGFNTIIMEWEATYPYKKHSILSNRYAYSRSEVKVFIEYCQRLGLDVIPLQQNLGHSEYILMHERYAYLRADKRQFSQVDPTRIDAARELFEELYSDMLSLHHSKYVHIGGDEARLLDCRRCVKAWSELGEEKGKSKLYVNYMKMIAEIVTRQGKIPLLWADMILAHPDAIVDMPKNVIYIDWNYGWKFDRFGENPTALIDKYGLKFWGATAMRSAPDDYHVTTWNKHIKNQADYIPYARKAGFEGIVLTSWATSGVYGYEWFGSEVVELYPVRQTYPHAWPNDGFRMNTSAFVEAVTQEQPIVPEEFAREYARERFGLSAKAGEALWNILNSEDLHRKVTVGSRARSGVRGLSSRRRLVKPTLASVRELKSELKQISPKRNKQEFAHYVMQLDLREFYLSFRDIEDWIQSEVFTDSDHAKAAQRLQKLLYKAADLDSLFSSLFHGVMYDSEIAKLNDYRSKKIRLLLQRIKHNK